MYLKVMTFNIQHCENFNTGKIDFDAFADAIKSTQADIIGLNEVRGRGTSPDYLAQAEILAEKTGYFCFFAPAIMFNGTEPYGNAILSRYPIKSAEIVPIPDPNPKKYNDYYETRCLLKATVDIGCDLKVLITHFGLNPDEHQNASDTIVRNIEDRKCILMGDFNVFPDSEYLTPIRLKMSDASDCFTSHILSFPSDNPDRKIDYIFTSRDISAISADIPAMTVSDHRPHTAVLDIKMS